ncbi:MAG: hypothetical protein DHS20C16_07360 [Phycisphaerae bacterium]|nr:MAG: hypothetical protein DHS20C16_07360 [Phycisphaerae bacterium]
MHTRRTDLIMLVATLTTLLVINHTAHAQFVEPDVTIINALQGENAGDSFGLEVMAIGDLDSDGAMEFIVSAPGNDEGANNAGKVYLYDGATQAIIRTHVGARANEALRNVMPGGDVNSDGFKDYIVGSGDGAVYVYSGFDGAELHEFTSVQAGEGFGFRSSSLKDIDGDGHDDIIVGAWNNDAAGNNAGRAYVYSGADGSLIRMHTGPFANAWFGHTVNELGDLDGDGVFDYCVGAPGVSHTSFRGQAFIYSGATGAEVYPHLTPIGTGLNFASWEPAGGQFDFNGDGHPDFAIGDIGDLAFGTETGRLYIYDGPTGTLLYTLLPPTLASGFGGITPNPDAHIGDVDGDGISDLLVGAWRSFIGAGNGGRAEIISGCSGALLRSITSNQPGVFLAGSRSGVGDVNGDGFTDFILGANGTNGSTGTVYLIAGQDHAILPGDLNGDGSVSVFDYWMLFTPEFDGPDATFLPMCKDSDLNHDGTVDLADFGIMQQHFTGL